MLKLISRNLLSYRVIYYHPVGVPTVLHDTIVYTIVMLYYHFQHEIYMCFLKYFI